MEIYNQMTDKNESNNNNEKKNDSEIKENLNDVREKNINENYKDFDIDKIKKLESFKVKDENINNVLILSDKRILISRYYIAIYNPKNNYNCDIYLKEKYINSIFQMEDGKIIYSNDDNYIKIIEVNEKQINGILVIKACVSYPKLYKLSNGKILEYGYDPKIYFYSYKNGSLNKDNQIIEIKKTQRFQDLCEINENEIAIYSTEEAILKDWNDYLIFYNYQNNKKRDKEIQSYSFSESGYLCLLNANYILVVTYSKIILVDTKKMSFISDLKNSFDSMLALNENIFLGLKSRCIYQLEIDNNKKKII
jgi:hypothetical protein